MISSGLDTKYQTHSQINDYVNTVARTCTQLSLAPTSAMRIHKVSGGHRMYDLFDGRYVQLLLPVVRVTDIGEGEDIMTTALRLKC